MLRGKREWWWGRGEWTIYSLLGVRCRAQGYCCGLVGRKGGEPHSVREEGLSKLCMCQSISTVYGVTVLRTAGMHALRRCNSVQAKDSLLWRPVPLSYTPMHGASPRPGLFFCRAAPRAAARGPASMRRRVASLPTAGSRRAPAHCRGGPRAAGGATHVRGHGSQPCLAVRTGLGGVKSWTLGGGHGGGHGGGRGAFRDGRGGAEREGRWGGFRSPVDQCEHWWSWGTRRAATPRREYEPGRVPHRLLAGASGA